MARPIHLDLCSGIGGFAIASEIAGYKTAGFCEIEPFARRVLRHHWPEVPIHDDITTLTGEIIRGWADRVDLVTAGYPCQPFSVTGKRGGTDDARHLWPHILRIIGDIRPRWCLFENVAGHVSMGLDDVIADLEAAQYACWSAIIPACAVDAPHKRDRLWVVAHATGSGVEGVRPCGHGDGSQVERAQVPVRGGSHPVQPATRRAPEQRMGGEDDGLPGWVAGHPGFGPGWDAGVTPLVRVDPMHRQKLAALGNAIVPEVAARILLAMREADLDAPRCCGV